MNPETTKIIDRLVMSRDGLQKLDIADYAMIRDAREAMADAANALTNYAKTFLVIQETDQAAAPHLYPASGEDEGTGVNAQRIIDGLTEAVQIATGETQPARVYVRPASGEVGGEKRVQEAAAALKADADALLLKADPEMAARVALGAALLETLLSALSEATERAERMERERDEARQGERNLSEHARKVAGEANEAFGVVEHMDEFWDACGYPSNRGHLTPAEQVSALVRERDDAETRAQSAQAEATRLKEKLDEAGKLLSPLASAAGFIDSETTGFQDDDTLDLTLEDIVLERIKISHLRAALRWTEEATQGEKTNDPH